MKLSPSLILHGGTGQALTGRDFRNVQKKIARILKLAYACLAETNALEAAVFAVRLLEDDPRFNAGTGAMLQADGRARLSASVMDGKENRFAAVINVEKVKNPVLIAKSLLSEESRVLSGEGAQRFAHESGFQLKDTRTRQSIERWKKWKQKKSCDTVGACALDRFGNLASATSTGGRGGERPGRVSDSGMPVADYADEHCAISATGFGEEIMEEGLAVKIATRVRDGLSVKEAFAKTFSEVRARGRRMGAIAVDKKGRLAWNTTEPCLIYGWQRGNESEIFKR